MWGGLQGLIQTDIYRRSTAHCSIPMLQSTHAVADRQQGSGCRDRPQSTEAGECMRRPILKNSNPGQAIYEPFMDSGTALIAAESDGRVCYGIVAETGLGRRPLAEPDRADGGVGGNRQRLRRSEGKAHRGMNGLARLPGLALARVRIRACVSISFVMARAAHRRRRSRTASTEAGHMMRGYAVGPVWSLRRRVRPR